MDWAAIALVLWLELQTDYVQAVFHQHSLDHSAGWEPSDSVQVTLDPHMIQHC
jgi:hypothetical protein